MDATNDATDNQSLALSLQHLITKHDLKLGATL